MGAAFTYIATYSASESVWNFRTILPVMVATFNFAVAVRLVNIHLKMKKIKNNKKK
ncbi:DUF4305 domain-containing protein [Halobacillus sp. Marseille-Q1614]|uniref:DUF4305 domain-containing protein n=1 Tax=Halobacillus sp. Marseille-Q1614 TaxID=2709134 RepID=UPI0020C293CE|nr:DUF4305 domain-containing protein [Halobacillus sp. Marseille-Q1614]